MPVSPALHSADGIHPGRAIAVTVAGREGAGLRGPTGHVPALDGVRGIAIAMVLLHHCGWPRVFGEGGWIGVDLFFVLSGYLITGILADTRESVGRGRSFYVRRALRIFPLYYAVLFALFVVAPIVHPISWAQYRALVPEQAWYWTYLSDWRMAFAHPPTVTLLGHFWTLSIEEQFYWVWPVVIWSLTGRAAMRLCGGLLMAASILRVYLVLHYPLRDRPVVRRRVRVSVPADADRRVGSGFTRRAGASRSRRGGSDRSMDAA